jgi:hypothetical protein
MAAGLGAGLVAGGLTTPFDVSSLSKTPYLLDSPLLGRFHGKILSLLTCLPRHSLESKLLNLVSNSMRPAMTPACGWLELHGACFC